VAFLGRRVMEDDVVDGYTIPAQAIVIVSPYVTHRHPEFWQNPEGFDPERFIGDPDGQQHRFAYFPFSTGPRQCIGNNFALLEGVLLLATIAQRFELDLVPGHPVEPEPMLTLRPRHGMMMTVRAR
jgi:cytochrome P450